MSDTDFLSIFSQIGGFVGKRNCNNRFVWFVLHLFSCKKQTILDYPSQIQTVFPRWFLKKYPGNAGGIAVTEGLFDHPVGEILHKYLETIFQDYI